MTTATTEPYRRDMLLHEWQHLHDPNLSISENCRRLAPRLGMTKEAMEKALGRAGVRNPVTPTRPKVAGARCATCAKLEYEVLSAEDATRHAVRVLEGAPESHQRRTLMMQARSTLRLARQGLSDHRAAHARKAAAA